MTSTDLMTIDAQTGEVLPPELALREPPAQTLAAAQRAAQALQDVISRKKKPVIFGGEQYLEYEDWQTVGRFYGVTAKVQSVAPIELAGRVDGHGFHATAIALTADGREISRAEAYCMADEANWKDKPIFQLASMAQTRACAKALRNVLAWVVVLAGYRGTPAEELPAEERTRPALQPTGRRPARAAAGAADEGLITEKQQKRFFALAKQHGWSDDAVRALLTREGLSRSSQIGKVQYDTLCTELVQGPPPSGTLPDVEQPPPF